jgi:hypothetical protein
MKTTFKNFEISSNPAIDSVFNPWKGQRTGQHFRFDVFVESESGEEISFEFFGSSQDFEDGKNELEEHDLLHAFYCVLGDVNCGLMDFEEFCSEMGYSTDSRQAYQTWEACKESAEQLNDLGLNQEEIYDLLNELSELV